MDIRTILKVLNTGYPYFVTDNLIIYFNGFGDPITGLIVGGLVAGGIGYSAYQSSKAQEKAAQNAIGAAEKAGDTASATQLRMFYESLAIQEPWLAAGREALPEMEKITYNYKLSPLYNIAKEELERGLLRFGAKTGATGAATEQYSKGLERLLAGEEEKQYGRIATLAGYGKEAAQTGAASAMQTGAGLANIAYGTGERVGGYLQDIGAARGAFYSGMAGLPFQAANTFALGKYAGAWG